MTEFNPETGYPMEKAPAFMFYPKDWLSDSRVAFMSLKEKGTYITLLCYMWMNSDCRLHNNISGLCRMVGCTKKVIEAVLPCFEVDEEGFLYQKRLRKEKEKQTHNRIVRARAGRRGGKIRAERMGEARKIGNHSKKEWEEMRNFFKNECVSCSKVVDKLSKDHVVPLKKEGGNSITNIQPLCVPCNSVKHDTVKDYRLKWCEKNGLQMPSKWLLNDIDLLDQKVINTPDKKESKSNLAIPIPIPSKEESNKEENNNGLYPNNNFRYSDDNKVNEAAELVCEIYFITEIQNMQSFSYVYNCLEIIRTEYGMDNFLKQVKAYKEYKILTGQERHRFQKFLGDPHDKCSFGAWCSNDWAKMLEEYKAKQPREEKVEKQPTVEEMKKANKENE